MISYLGGKYRQASWINGFIKPDITTYVEAFGGMFWAFLKSDRKFERVVYNDINPFNANLFLCFKNHGDFHDLIDFMEPNRYQRFYNYQKELYKSDLQFQYNPDKADFEIGYKYAYVLTHVFSGSNPENASFNGKSGSKPKFEILKSKLTDEKWTKKLDEITDIDCLSYDDVISKYDSPTTHFYLDPPYFGTENYYSNHTFNEIQDHVDLANCVKHIKGGFSLSYYEFPGMMNLYSPGSYTYNSKEYTKCAGAKKGKKINGKGVELLITNNSTSNVTEVPEYGDTASTFKDADINYVDN